MKKRGFAICAVLILVAAIGVYWYIHPTHYRFNDRYILGNTQEKIIEKYGPAYHMDNNVMTYQIQDDTPEMIMGYDNSLWYVIAFQDGVAVSVYLREGYPGG